MQLNVLNRLKAYIGNKNTEILINSFIYSSFNYCPLVWHFSSCKSAMKIEKIHKRCLRMILNDNTSNYQTLLEKSKKNLTGNKKAKKLSNRKF